MGSYTALAWRTLVPLAIALTAAQFNFNGSTRGISTLNAGLAGFGIAFIPILLAMIVFIRHPLSRVWWIVGGAQAVALLDFTFIAQHDLMFTPYAMLVALLPAGFLGARFARAFEHWDREHGRPDIGRSMFSSRMAYGTIVCGAPTYVMGTFAQDPGYLPWIVFGGSVVVIIMTCLLVSFLQRSAAEPMLHDTGE